MGGIHLVSDQGRSRGSFSRPTRVTPRHAENPSLKTQRGRVYLAYARCYCYPYPDRTPIWFSARVHGAWQRTRVYNGYGSSPSLRVTDAGRPRIAFWTTSGLRYGAARSMTGDFVTSAIPGTSSSDGAPSLVLDERDNGHIAWGRGGSLSDTHRAVYYARQSEAGWATPQRVTSESARAVAISIDANDRPHVAVGGRGVREFVRRGYWRRRVVARSVYVHSVSLRVTSSGRTVIAYSGADDGVFVVGA
jgi:hypothetical protein